MATGTTATKDGCDVTPHDFDTLDFDDDTLKAIAEVYFQEGNQEYRKKNLDNAVYFYTEGIKVECKDKELKVKLYSNRATANFGLGNNQETLNDAWAAISLEPTCTKAIERGASACLKLHLYDEAIGWCDKGLANDRNNKRLLAIRTEAAKEHNGMQGYGYSPHNTEKRVGGAFAPELGNVKHLKHVIDNLHLSLQTARQVEDREGESLACMYLGLNYYLLGDFERAIEYHRLHLTTSKTMGNWNHEGVASGNLGTAYSKIGDDKTAAHFFELQLEIAKKLGQVEVEGQSSLMLGLSFYKMTDFKKLSKYHDRFLKTFGVEDRFAEGRTHENVGNDGDNLKNFHKAVRYYKHSLEISRQLGATEEEFSANYGLGNIYSSVGDFNSAVAYHERSIELAQAAGDVTKEGQASCCLGNDYYCLGKLEKAMNYFEDHLRIAKDTKDKFEEAQANGNLGKACFNTGDFKKAIAYHERCLNISKEINHRAEEGLAYGSLGNDYNHIGDFKKAIECQGHCLQIHTEIGDRAGESMAYCGLGNAYGGLGDYQKSIECFKQCLTISTETGDKAAEASAYGGLGNTYGEVGNFMKAIECHRRELQLAQRVGDQLKEGRANINLGNAYRRLKNFKKAIRHQERQLKIAKQVGDITGEGLAYSSLGNSYLDLGDFKKSIDYHERSLEIALGQEDRVSIGNAYGNLGVAYFCLGDPERGKDYHQRQLYIAQELGDRFAEAKAFYCLGCSLELLGNLEDSVRCYQSSVEILNDIKTAHRFKDKWKINLRDMYRNVYTKLWLLLLKQGRTIEALLAADQGRAQALKDLMEFNYGIKSSSSSSSSPPALPLQSSSSSSPLSSSSSSPLSSSLSSSPSSSPSSALECHTLHGCSNETLGPIQSVFTAVQGAVVTLWVIQNGRSVILKRKKLSDDSSLNDATQYIQRMMQKVCQTIGVRAEVKCEDRSLETREETTDVENSACKIIQSDSPDYQESPLETLYNVAVRPMRDLIEGDELIIVPDGPLWLAPYAAFVDSNSKYLCEYLRIRVVPSLTTLKLLVNCPVDYHQTTGALLVGDPWVQEIITPKGNKLQQLPCAREEVRMIGKILNIAPLTGTNATKEEALKRLSSVALVHIAAHGRMETGEIALAPNPSSLSQPPKEEDYLLTMKDVLSAKLRARLVVLSCCHSACGEIKAEGVVGIARAFLGAGARSVLVSLWAIDDKATLEFMKIFYSHLAEGRRASEALNQAMKSMRESDAFNEVKYWAPFVLIGDDVSLTFGASSDVSQPEAESE